MKKIVRNRHKIQNVTMGENRLLKMRRKKYEKNLSKSQNAGQKFLHKLTEDREKREERGRRQQAKIAQVSNMKDQLLQARNEIMGDRFRERDARIEHKMKEKARLAKMKQDNAADGKDERSKRQAHATKVREMRNKRLTARLKEKEAHVRAVQIQKKQEVEALRIRKA